MYNDTFKIFYIFTSFIVNKDSGVSFLLKILESHKGTHRHTRVDSPQNYFTVA